MTIEWIRGGTCTGCGANTASRAKALCWRCDEGVCATDGCGRATFSKHTYCNRCQSARHRERGNEYAALAEWRHLLAGWDALVARRTAPRRGRRARR